MYFNLPTSVLHDSILRVFMFVGFFTARVRTYDGRLCFHRCVSVQLLGGGTPSLSIPIPIHPCPGGVPDPALDGGVPQPWIGGVPRVPPQNSKHLLWLCGRRCASCVHTGGLSCYFFTQVVCPHGLHAASRTLSCRLNMLYSSLLTILPLSQPFLILMWS